MSQKRSASLMDDVKAALPTRRGFAPWYETLPEKLLAEIVDIKARWKSGEIAASKTAMAVSLSKALTERGIKIGHLGVIRWLEKA